MIVLKTLRARLLVALTLVFGLTLGVSTALDRAALRPGSHGLSGGLAGTLDQEPYQDGLVLAAGSVPALALIWVVSSWSLRPLIRASAEARRAGPGDPLARISQAGLPAEIAPLVEAVNGALDRMAAAIEAERRFTENAAHELRTPLTVLKLRLEQARASQTFDWPAIEHDLAQMQRLVSQLLDLARKEHAGKDHAGAASMPANLSRLAREAAAMILPLAEAQGRAVIADLPETLPVSGQPDDLRDAIRNLLENAFVHGAGAITLSGRAEGALAVLVIADQGPGVPAPARERMFERFGKGATGHGGSGRGSGGGGGGSGGGGSGLGLAIVREVARNHAGTIRLLPGPGCQMQLALPLA